MVHGACEFFEGAFEREWLPAFAAIERQAIGTGAERSKSEPWVRAVLVRTANDEMAATRSHLQTTRGLTRVEQRLQGEHHRGQPRNVRTPTWSRHLVSVPTVLKAAQSRARDYRADLVAG